MLCIGIDVAKRKHDCCIIDSDALKTVESFTFPNSREGFDMLLSKISELGIPKDKIRVGIGSNRSLFLESRPFHLRT